MLRIVVHDVVKTARDNSITVPAGTQVLELTKEEDGWSLIKVGSDVGYVPNEALSTDFTKSADSAPPPVTQYNNPPPLPLSDPPVQPDPPAQPDIYVVKFDFVAQEQNQLCCLEGDQVKFILKENDDWWRVENKLGQQGSVPLKHFQHIECYDDITNVFEEERRARPQTELTAPSRMGKFRSSVRALKRGVSATNIPIKPGFKLQLPARGTLKSVSSDTTLTSPNQTTSVENTSPIFKSTLRRSLKAPKDPEKENDAPNKVKTAKKSASQDSVPNITAVGGERKSRWSSVKNKLHSKKESLSGSKESDQSNSPSRGSIKGISSLKKKLSHFSPKPDSKSPNRSPSRTRTWDGPEHKDQLATIESRITSINKEGENTGKFTQDQRGTLKMLEGMRENIHQKRNLLHGLHTSPYLSRLDLGALCNKNSNENVADEKRFNTYPEHKFRTPTTAPEKPPRKGNRNEDSTPEELTEEASKYPAQETPPVQETPRSVHSANMSLSESCVWDTYTPALHPDGAPPTTSEHGVGTEHSVITEHGVGIEHGVSMEHCVGTEHTVKTEEGSATTGLAESDPSSNTVYQSCVSEQPTISTQMSTVSGLSTQSGIEIDQFEEVFGTLPDPPEAGSRTSTFSPTSAKAFQGGGCGGGSTVTIVNVDPPSPTITTPITPHLDPDHSSTPNNIPLTSDPTELDILNSSELSELLTEGEKTISPPKRTSSCNRKLQYASDLSIPSINEEGKSCDVSPRNRIESGSLDRRRVRKPRSDSTASVTPSVLSEAPSEAASLSGRKSGIYYFAGEEGGYISTPVPDPIKVTEKENDIPPINTPKLQHIIRSDPTYNKIMDDNFFEFGGGNISAGSCEEVEEKENENEIRKHEDDNTSIKTATSQDVSTYIIGAKNEEISPLQFRTSSFANVTGCSRIQINRRSVSESEIFDLITPSTGDQLGSEDPLSGFPSVAVRTVPLINTDPDDTYDDTRDDSVTLNIGGDDSANTSGTHETGDTPNSNCTHETLDTPDEESAECGSILVKESIIDNAKSHLFLTHGCIASVTSLSDQNALSSPRRSIISDEDNRKMSYPDDSVLDMSANGTLSFIYSTAQYKALLEREGSLNFDVTGSPQQIIVSAGNTDTLSPVPDVPAVGTDVTSSNPCSPRFKQTDQSPQVSTVIYSESPGVKRRSDSEDSPNKVFVVRSPGHSPGHSPGYSPGYSPEQVMRSDEITTPTPQVSPEKIFPPPAMSFSYPSDHRGISSGSDKFNKDVSISPSSGGSKQHTYSPLYPITPTPSTMTQYSIHNSTASIPPHEVFLNPQDQSRPPMVSSVHVLHEEDEDEEDKEDKSRGKIQKQFSVHCDGKENLRVESSPFNRRKHTSSQSTQHGTIDGTQHGTTDEVEVDSAMRYPAQPVSDVPTPGDNPLSSYLSQHQRPGGSTVFQQTANVFHPTTPTIQSAPPFIDSSSVHPSAPWPSQSPDHRPGYAPPPLPGSVSPNLPGRQPPPLPSTALPYPKLNGPLPLPSTALPYPKLNGPNQHIYPTLPSQLSGHSDIDDTHCSQQYNREIELKHMGVNTDSLKCSSMDVSTTKVKGGIFNKIQRSFKKIGKKKSKENIIIEPTLDTSANTTRTEPTIIVRTEPATPASRTEYRRVDEIRPVEEPRRVEDDPDPPSPSASAPVEEEGEELGDNYVQVEYEPGEKPKAFGDVPKADSPPPQQPQLYPNLNNMYPGPHTSPQMVPQSTPQMMPQMPGMMPPQMVFGQQNGMPMFCYPGYYQGMGGMWQYPVFPQFRAQTTTTTSTSSNIDCTRQSKRKKPQAPESPPLDHKCSEYHDPLILSKDLIRHVKRSCGLNSTRSRTAARAIVQCLQDSLPENTKLFLLSEILTAMDMSYMSRRTEQNSHRHKYHESGREDRRKRTRTRTNQESDEDLEDLERATSLARCRRRHKAKRLMKEEKILMSYLREVLVILEEMKPTLATQVLKGDMPPELNPFLMYYQMAKDLINVMYMKLSQPQLGYSDGDEDDVFGEEDYGYNKENLYSSSPRERAY